MYSINSPKINVNFHVVLSFYLLDPKLNRFNSNQQPILSVIGLRSSIGLQIASKV